MNADSEPSRARRPFELIAGHAALDFVNTLDDRFIADGPVELLGDYGDLLRFLVQAQLLEGARAQALSRSVNAAAGARALRAARELREALAATLYAGVEARVPLSTAVRTLSEQLRDADQHRELHWQEKDGQPAFAWSRGRYAKHAELPVWMLADAAGQLLLSDAMRHVRACGATPCRWLFLDTSKNHTRRWCDMKVCGNRMKARRFQARQAAAS